jgi:hypothetical protein
VLATRRMRVRFALFAAVFGVVFLLSGLGLGISSYLAASATAGAQFGLAGLAGSNGGFRISIPLAKDSAVQDARVRSEIARTLVSDGAPVPITVRRDIETPDAVGLVGSHVVVRSALASVPDLSERARLTAGRWPRNAAEASMQADAARLLGVRVGDHFVLPGGAHITIVGLWHVRNEADPSWLGAEIPLSGIDDDGVSGFIVIDPSLWTNAESDPVARWTIIPRADRDTASQLDALQRAPDSVPLAIQTDPRNGTNVNQDGRLQPAMVPIINNVQAAAAVSTAPLVLVAVLGIVTLTELARMLGQLRSGETALLRARGATRRRLVLTTSAEATVIAVPAAAAGACVAAMILAATTSAFSLTSVGVIAAGATVAATVALMAAGAAFASPEDTRGLARDARIRSTVGTGAIALTVLAGVVAVSQFLLYGSPFTTSSSGGRALDPLAVAAPAFGLAALALIALALFPLVARAAERFARRDLGLAAVSARQLARRNRAALTPILLVSLATGSLVLACAYSGTWHDSYAQTRAVAIGTGVRVA